MQQVWQIRETIAVFMLAISAYTDIRERNIYMMPLIISSSGTLVISVISLLSANTAGGWGIILDGILLPAAFGAILILLTKAFRSFIGEGDGYLAAALGPVTGIRICILSVTAAVFLAFMYSVVRISGKKRRRFGTIPFAPFVLAGLLVVLICEV